MRKQIGPYTPPQSSWWATATREDFRAAFQRERARIERMRATADDYKRVLAAESLQWRSMHRGA